MSSRAAKSATPDGRVVAVFGQRTSRDASQRSAAALWSTSRKSAKVSGRSPSPARASSGATWAQPSAASAADASATSCPRRLFAGAGAGAAGQASLSANLS